MLADFWFFPDDAAALDDSLTRLIESARYHKPGAFAALVEEMRPQIFQLAARFTRSEADFDDLTQEISLRLWKSLSSLRDSTLFLAWFKSLAVRACYDWLRRRRTRQDHEISHDLLAERGELPPPSAADDVAATQAATLLQDAMEILKPDERLVITLLELETHTVTETARLTGWSEGNVKVRAHRARAALKQALRICLASTT